MVRPTAATFRVAQVCFLALMMVGFLAVGGCSGPCDSGCCGPQCGAQCSAEFTPCACPDNPFDSVVPPWKPAGAIGEAEANSGGVNEAALTEPKGGSGCATCRQPPQLQQRAPVVQQRGPVVHVGRMPPIILAPGETLAGVGPVRIVTPNRPATMPAPQRPLTPNPPAYLEDVREGVFECVRCRKAAVGREWHEVWGDDDTPLTILCESCWRSTSVEERRGYLDAYMKSAGLTPAQRFYARAAYAE